jgi:hypothetical protein
MSTEHSQASMHYFYNASAFGVAGELTRPARYSIPTQAATVLVPAGGRGYQRVEKFRHDNIVSFDSATVEVGGSYDERHNIHASYATSTLEGLNIADIVKADKVVTRLAIYSSAIEDADGKFIPENKRREENSFNITGSHFEHLTICGHPIDVKLNTQIFHKHDTYSKVESAYKDKATKGKISELLFWHKLSQVRDSQLENLERKYHALGQMCNVVADWKRNPNQPLEQGKFWCSAANHLELPDKVRERAELENHGCIIFIPKFGIVRLAELIIYKQTRALNMIRVDMCSTSDGSITGGGAGGNGGRPTGGGG